MAVQCPEGPAASVVPLIGYLAGALTTLAYVPQIVHVWRTRSARDLSMLMLLSLTGGVLAWLVYGVALRAWPIIVANAVALVLAVTLVVLKLVWR